MTHSGDFDISVVVPISERLDDIEKLFRQHREILTKRKLRYEFIFIIDGNFPQAETLLKKFSSESPDTVKVLKFHRTFGEAKALAAGFVQSSGRLILTLPSYFQVIPAEIGKLIDSFTDDIDVIVGNRYPRKDNMINRIQSRVFHYLVNRVSGESFQDISCGVRLLRREVAGKIHLYGDLHRFIPLLAIHKGFRVKELPLQQAREDVHLRVYNPGVYLRRMLDILTLFFLIKFTQKPLRFFGLLGCGIGFVGCVITLITVFQRIFYGIGLSERPLFLAGILFFLVGLQTFFIGLVAEIIIFMHMPEEPQYNIEKIIE